MVVKENYAITLLRLCENNNEIIMGTLKVMIVLRFVITLKRV